MISKNGTGPSGRTPAQRAAIDARADAYPHPHAAIAAKIDAAISRLAMDAKAVTMPAKLAVDGGKWPLIEIEE